MGYMGVMVYLDCTLINFMHFLVHPEKPPFHADQFHVPHDPLELLYVPVLVLVVHGGHDVDIDVRTPLPFLQHCC
jgi:hypothetical protein